MQLTRRVLVFFYYYYYFSKLNFPFGVLYFYYQNNFFNCFFSQYFLCVCVQNFYFILQVHMALDWLHTVNLFKSPRFWLKIFNVLQKQKEKSMKSQMDYEWVNKQQLFIFRWTIPLNAANIVCVSICTTKMKHTVKC